MRTFTASAILISGALAAAVSPPGTPVTVADLELRQVPTTTATSSSVPNAAAAAQEASTTAALAATSSSSVPVGTSTTTTLSSSTKSSTTTATNPTAVVNPILTSTSTSTLPTVPSSTTIPTTLVTAATTTTAAGAAAGAANPATVTSAVAATTTNPDPLDVNTWVTTKWSPQTNAAGATLGWTQGVYTQTWATVPDQLPAAGSGRIGYGQYDGDSVAAVAAVTGKGTAAVTSGAAGVIGADRVLGVMIVAVMMGMGFSCRM